MLSHLAGRGVFRTFMLMPAPPDEHVRTVFFLFDYFIRGRGAYLVCPVIFFCSNGARHPSSSEIEAHRRGAASASAAAAWKALAERGDASDSERRAETQRTAPLMKHSFHRRICSSEYYVTRELNYRSEKRSLFVAVAIFMRATRAHVITLRRWRRQSQPRTRCAAAAAHSPFNVAVGFD